MSLFMDIKKDPKKISISELLSFIEDNFIKNNPEYQNNVVIDADIDKIQENQKNQENDVNVSDINNINENNEIDIIPLQSSTSEHLKNLPNNLKKLFSSFELYRHGVVKNNEEMKNISLYTSLLICTKSDFKTKQIALQYVYVNSFTTILTNFVNSKFTLFNYKTYKWNKNDLVEQIKTFQNTKSLLKIISDMMFLNICILDVDQDNFMFVNNFSQFKKTIILLYIKTLHYEPISCDNVFCFDMNHDIMKYIFAMENVSILVPNINISNGNDGLVMNNEFDDLDKYIPSEKYNRMSFKDRMLLNTIKTNVDNVLNPKITEEDEIKNAKQTKPTSTATSTSTSSSSKQKQKQQIQTKQESNDNDNDTNTNTNDTNTNTNDTNTNDTNEINNIDDNSEDENNDYLTIEDITNDDIVDLSKTKTIILNTKMPPSIKELKLKIYNEKKMKLTELEEDAIKLDIQLSFNGKKKTKSVLIDEITKALASY